MANLKLLVPGTGGVTLADGFANDLGYPGPMMLSAIMGGLVGKSPDELIALLSMQHTPGEIAPTRTSLVDGGSIQPGHVVEAAYNQLPSDVRRWVYDWRADLRHNAQLLLDYLQRNKPAGGRWSLVGHSQGGLVVLLATKLLPAGGFAELVASVVLVAAPISGTVNAANALLQGDVMGSAAEPAFRQIVRTWPALYQMLPAWDVVTGDQGNAHPITSLDTWAGYDGVAQDMLDRADAVHGLLADPLTGFDGDIDLAIFMANNRPTGSALTWSAGGLTATLAHSEVGDTLVPQLTTLHRFSHAAQQYVFTFGGNVREHAYLLDDPSVATEVVKRLK